MKGIYLVTDQRACLGRSLDSIVADAARAGVSHVQVREKNTSTREFLELTLALKAILTPENIPLIVNDRVDIALAAKADGVHLGQTDMPVALARELMGPGAIIGLSVETWKDVTACPENLVDYLGVSPIFPTPTKTDTKAPWGIEGLARIRRQTPLPLVAIGGLDHSNLEPVIRAGADSIAVVSAICSADHPFEAARELSDIFNTTYCDPALPGHRRQWCKQRRP